MTDAPLPQSTTQSPALRIGLAAVLLLPAVLCCASQYAWPSLLTIVASFQDVSGLGASGQFVGADNYTNLFGSRPFITSVGFTLAILVVRLLAVTVVPLMVGYGLTALGAGPRKLIQAGLMFAVALFAPVAIGITWRLLTLPNGGLISGPVFSNPVTARLALLGIDGLYILGLAVAAGAVLYPMAARSGKAAIALVFGVFVIAVITTSLQTLVLPLVTTGGGPANSTTTLGLFLYRSVLQQFQFGVGAVVGTLILIPVMLLGLVAGILIVATRLSFAQSEPLPVDAANANRKPLKMGLLVLGLLPAILCCAASGLPLPWVAVTSLGGNAYGRFFADTNMGAIAVNTFLPAFVSAFFIELPVALAGAFAIGALRPLGKRSGVLLLVFSPWLFITVLPLLVPLIQSLMDSGRLSEFTALFTPFALSVPMLFILTLFFKGRTSANAAPVQAGLLLQALPLALGLTCLSFLMHLNEFLWPLLVAVRPDSYTLPLLINQTAQQSVGNQVFSAITLFWLPVTIVFFVIFAAWMVFYGHRLVLGRGEAERTTKGGV
jgi:ABC-type sugar transport system permease subunit